MPRGLKLPIGVSPSGGLAFVDHDENDAKIIALALGSGENENAFQQGITLGEAMVFDIADQQSRARIEARVYEIFEAFRIQKRFILLPETIEWYVPDDEQQSELRFKYLNIESDDIREFDSGRRR